MNNLTYILAGIEEGTPATAEQILPLVYEELRRLAASRMAAEHNGHTLQPTALVHEAYLRLIGPKQTASWNSKGHFFAAAAEAMRRILVENARRKQRIKHGGRRKRVELNEPAAREPDEPLLALDEALSQLALEDSLAAKVVELRRFAGLNHEQVAGALGVTIYQARQKWTYARAWLREAMRDDK